MGGFLDRKTRVVDMVLTGHGKDMLSRGQLRFCYWVPYDDEVLYDPFLSESGSLSDAQFSSSVDLSIETAPVREAVFGYKSFDFKGLDRTNVNNPIFTMAQQQSILPRAEFPDDLDREITTKQRRVQRVYNHGDPQGNYLNSIGPVDLGTERFDSSTFTLDFSYKKDSFPDDFSPDGFHIRILRSGSSGYSEVRPQRDMNNDLSYNNDVRVFTGRKGS